MNIRPACSSAGPARYDECLQHAAGSAPADDIDTTLMMRAAGGDLAAFEELVCRNQAKAWAVAWRCLGDAAEAQDVVQEAFLRTYKAASRYRPTAKFRTYLYRVVTRLCLDWEAKKRPEYTETIISIPDSSSGPEALFGQNELSDAVSRCLANLPINQRLAITLRHYDGMSYDEIAEVLNVSAKAIDSLLQRARGKLRQCLQPFKWTSYSGGFPPFTRFIKRVRFSEAPRESRQVMSRQQGRVNGNRIF